MQYKNVKFDKKITIFQWFANIHYFKTVKLGGMEKRQDNFAEEVMNQINN